MRFTKSAFVALSVAAVFAVGCSATSSSSPTSPSAGSGTTRISADQLAGSWNLVSIQPAGQVEQPVPAGASYTLTLAEGRVSTKADCNMCGGSFAINGQTLTIAPALACTRAACPTMAFEGSYEMMLGGDSTVRIDGTTLTLTSSRGVLRFNR